MHKSLRRRDFIGMSTGISLSGYAPSLFAKKKKDRSRPRGRTNASIERMNEWRDWKFGLFIHWGPFSQSGNANGRIGSMKGDLKKGLNWYRTFNPVKFDPNKWADMAKEAGMRYSVMVAKHHDGFCNWPTKVTDYSVSNKDCPWSKSKNPDLVKAYLKAFRSKGIQAGIYFSHLNYSDPMGMGEMIGAESGSPHRSSNRVEDIYPEKAPKEWKEYVRIETEQVRELMTQYGKLPILWFDISWCKSGQKDAVPMLDMIRKEQTKIILSPRGTSEYGDFKVAEQFIPLVPSRSYDGFWEFNCPISVGTGGGFWYKGGNPGYRTPEEIIPFFADVLHKGGNFLLNVGPKGDGTIPEGEINAIKGVGKWVRSNSEAIYSTKASPWGMWPEWGRITIKGQNLYLFVFDWKRGAKLELDLPKIRVKSVSLLKDKTQVKFAGKGNGIEITLPEKAAPDKHVSVVKVEFTGTLKAEEKWPEEMQGGKHPKYKVWHFDKKKGMQVDGPFK